MRTFVLSCFLAFAPWAFAQYPPPGGMSSGTGGSASSVPSVGNVTAVTANGNVTSDQALQEIALPAGFLNILKQETIFNSSGTFTIAAAQTPTLTFKVKLCTVSGCGSGTVVTLASMTSAATIAATGNPWNLTLTAGTSLAGASGTLIVHGFASVDIAASAVAPETVYNDGNTAVSSAIDLTAALFVDWTVTTSTGNAGNIFIQQNAGVIAPGAAGATGATGAAGTLAAIADQTVLGNVSGGSAVPIGITQAQVLTFLGGTSGTGVLLRATSPTITTPTISGHPVIEGVTSTGATGTGKFVFDASPTISGHATIEGVTATGATGTGKFLFDASPTISGHATIEGVTATGATGTGKFLFDTSPTISAPTISGHPVIEGVTSTGATGTGKYVFDGSPTIATPTLTTPVITGLYAVLSKTTNYQVLAADFAQYKAITIPSGSPSITLVASGSQPAAGQYIDVINYGSGTVLISRSGQNLNGATSAITLAAALTSPGLSPTSARIWSDGTDYFAAIGGPTAASAQPASPLVKGGGPLTFTGPRGYLVFTGASGTAIVPVPAQGYEFCAMATDNVASTITLSALGSSAMYENTARTAYGTAGTGTLVSGGAVGDKICILGIDSTHYLTVSFTGTWVAN